MRMRRTLAILGILALALAGTAYCASGVDSRLQETLTDLGLEVIDRAPAGVTPLELRSLGELKRFLRRAGTDGLLLTDQFKPEEYLGATVETVAIDIRELHYSYICNPVWRTRFNLWADVYVASSGSFHWIDDVRSVRVGLSGFHPFMRLADKYTDDYIYPNQQRARIEGGGTLEYYLFLQGVLTYYSQPAYIIAYYSI